MIRVNDGNNIWLHQTKKSSVKPVTKTEAIQNNFHLDTPKSKPHDTIMTYCPSCQFRLDIVINHSQGKNEFFQLVNVPDRIIEKLGSRKLYCNMCKNTILLEKQSQKTHNSFYLLKIDCSQMSTGMESWYEDAIPKSLEGEYEL